MGGRVFYRVIGLVTLIGFMVPFLFSCRSANQHLQIAKKHILKAEALGAEWSADTVVMDFPVYIESVKVDTVFTSLPGDTVVIQKDRLKIKYVRFNTPKDTVYIEGECLPDTVKIKVPVAVNKEIKARFPWFWVALAFAAGGLLIALLKK